MSAHRSIVHVIAGLGAGGAERLLLDLTRRRRGDGERHVVVSLLPGGALLPEFRDAAIPVHTLDMARGVPGPRAIRRLAAILDAEGAGVMQTWMYHANLLGLLAARQTRVRPRIVWCLHAAALDFRRYPVLTRLTTRAGALLSRQPDVIVANSAVTRAYHEALGYRPRAWRVIHNGVDVERFRPDDAARASVRGELGLDSRVRLVGMFARWDPMKDHATFFRAAVRVAQVEPSVHFLVAGEGMDRHNASLMRLMTDTGAGATGRVHLLGVRRDMPRLDAALDVAAVTSISGESFCLSAAEAMSCAVPCVVTDLTFLPTLVGDTGVVVPQREPVRFAEGILQVLRGHLTGGRQAGAEARRRIEANFSLDAMMSGYDDLYSDLLGAGRGVAAPSGAGAAPGTAA